MSADPVTFMLVGEFCEKDGPVVRHLYAIDHEGMCQSFPQEMWVPGTAAQLQQFMMRAMSGDHVFPEAQDAPLERRSCEVMMDRVKWIDDRDMIAYVSTVTLHDVFARGYARTACVAYLSSDEHKVFTISHWLSQECQDITRALHDASLNSHRGELVMCIAGIRHLLARVAAHEAGNGDLPVGLTERHRNGLQGELEALSQRVRRAKKKVQAPPPAKPAKRGPLGGFGEETSPLSGDSFENDLQNLRANGSLTYSFCNTSFANLAAPLSVTDEEAVDIADRLITLKGTKVLRPLEVVCGDDYVRVEDKIGRALFAFSMDTVFLLEHMTQMMQPLPRLFEQRIGEGMACHWPANDAEPVANDPVNLNGSLGEDTNTNRFFLKIGDFIAVDPKLRRDPPQIPANQHTEFSWLSEGRLFATLREFGVHEIVTVMFHALACRPIIVCGEDEEDVLEAMRIASTFVPGVLQSGRDRFGVGVMPFDATGKVRVTYEHLEKYAVIGCHPSSILYTEDRATRRYLSAPCVWHIHTYSTAPQLTGKKGGRSRTIKVYGHPYTLQVKPTVQPQQTAEKLHQDPFDRFMSSITYTPPLLLEVFDLLSQRITRPKEEDALSHYLRLTLKRIFVDYASMAACVLHSLMDDVQAARRSSASGYFQGSGSTTSQMTSPQQPLSSRKPTNTSFSGSTSTLPAGLFPTTPNPGIQASPVVGNASFTSVAASVVNGVVVAAPQHTAHKFPYVVTECDVRQILTFRHGLLLGVAAVPARGALTRRATGSTRGVGAEGEK
ncbi:Hypothetical protein, putative [Bodo saltans]|uniref:UDENN FLCN/SMCR8-type domain-containing protein n=1 Tax=Bodo saltans TaxID=75058 RepID=A0A0S4IWA3_BODSA|nr:Hypothetical protein, putative [Bodo saltans]|eukprot:CUG26932.1 Hypothetical protein, putative [Bodo saltans]